MSSHASAILNRSPLVILLFRSAQDISKIRVFHSAFVQTLSRMLSHSSHLNSTSGIYLFKQSFNGVSFEWALTHRSFPRILPDSSYFPEISSNFFSKFDVRMNYHQSYVFLQDRSNSFHFWLNLVTPG